MRVRSASRSAAAAAFNAIADKYTNNQPNQIKSNHFYCHITTAQVPW